MARIVIECGEGGYWAAFGMIRSGEFPEEKVVNKFLIGDSGYIYLEADELEMDELLKLVKGASIIRHEKEPKINVFKD